jgi:hypothetical protein
VSAATNRRRPTVAVAVITGTPKVQRARVFHRDGSTRRLPRREPVRDRTHVVGTTSIAAAAPLDAYHARHALLAISWSLSMRGDLKLTNDQMCTAATDIAVDILARIDWPSVENALPRSCGVRHDRS